jgi:hypothetical protein
MVAATFESASAKTPGGGIRVILMQSRMTGPGLTVFLALAGCGSGGTGGGTAQTSPGATVNLVIADTPSANVTILSFQVQITGAVLQPGSVSILPRPVTVDLAQLVSDTGFLASTVIGSATYTSLQMTFADPQVTILNDTGAVIALPGQTCAAGATCTFTPTLNNVSVTISNGLFPLTLTASSTTGLNLDLSIPDLLQSDLSITLANGTSVNLSLLSAKGATAQQANIDDVLGTITAISGDQVKVTTSFGDVLVLTDSSSTAYNFPSSVCSTASASCLAAGQIVTVDLSLLGDGSLGIDSLSYVGSPGSQLVKGLVLSTNTAGATPSAQLLLQREVNASSLSAGQIATVSFPTATSYAVGTAVYPEVSAGSFVSAADLQPGQELILSVGSDLVTATMPSFSTSAVYLEPSQVVGAVATVDTGTSSLEVTGLSGLFTGSRPIIQQVDVQTGTSTVFVGFSSSSVADVTVGQFIAAKGPLFNTSGTSDLTLSAMQLRGRTSGN